MTVKDEEDLFAALGKGAQGFDEIQGTPESSWLDFKGGPYRLAGRREKLELAKDVSALANAGGGVIVIGVATEKDATTSLEVASAPRPVPTSMLDADQMRKVIRQYVYPPIQDVRYKLWPAGIEEKALFTISIPAQQDPDKYFIVTEGLSEDGEPRSNMVGVFVRDGDASPPLPPSLIYELVRSGRQFKRLGGDRVENLTELMQFLDTLGLTAHRRSVEEILPDLDTQLSQDATDAGLSDEPHLFAQAWRRPGFEIEDIHSPQFRAVFEDPPQLRPNGFNIDFFGSTEILRGGGLRRTRHGVGTLSVLPTGMSTLIVGAYFLGWAMEKTSVPEVINPLVVIENIGEFCRFMFDHVSARDTQTRTTSFRAGLVGLQFPGPKKLVRDHPNRLAFARPKAPPTDVATIITEEVVGDDAESVAYELLRQIHREYGMPPEDIMFADPTRRRLDFEALVKGTAG